MDYIFGGNPVADSLLLLGAAGVDVFFVISGFIMWHTTHGRTMGGGDFMLRRLIRVVPLYWVLTAVYVVLLLAAPAVFRSSRFELDHVLASFAFIPYPHPVMPYVAPVIIPGWTLIYEMAFYVLFAVGLMLSGRSSARFAFVGLVILLAATTGLLVDTTPAAGFLLSAITLEFLFGMAIAALVGRIDEGAPATRWGLPLLLLGLALLVGPAFFVTHETHVQRVVLWGIPAALIVLGAVLAEKARPRKFAASLLFVGAASYAIYLSHPFGLAGTRAVWTKLGLPSDSAPALAAYATVTLGCVILGGAVCYLVLEKPLAIWLRARTGALRGHDPAATPSAVAAPPAVQPTAGPRAQA